ncbi:MAG: hypothetical protein HPY66_0933 [Firmicutes bacterium]|nr:hypothetical protein [Bacillota bacterium]MDI6705944.1 efflux RND transporter periplasmic adaptor subunit [Bacillota bacterium]
MLKLKRYLMAILWSVLVLLVFSSVVELVLMWKSDKDAHIEAEGVLEEANSVEVYTENPVKVISVNVREGDRVQKDQPLALVESGDFAIELEKAQVSLRQAELDLEKLRETIPEKEREIAQAELDLQLAEKEYGDTVALYGQGAISDRDLELSEAELKKASVSLENTRDDLKYTYIEIKNMENRIKLAELGAREAEEKVSRNSPIIRSPAGGTVTRVNVKNGTFTDPLEPAFAVSDLSDLQIKLNIKAEDIARVDIGQEVEITTDAAKNETYRGVVDAISPMVKLDERGLSSNALVEVTVKVIDRNRMFMPGFPVEAKIMPDRWSHEVDVASTSILPDRDMAYVYGLTGDQIWTVYTDRNGESPPEVFLAANSALTGELIGKTKLSGGQGIKSNPRILKTREGAYFVCWEAEEKAQRIIEYTIIDNNMQFSQPRQIQSEEFDLVNPSVFTSEDGENFLSVIRKTARDFGFYIYSIQGNDIALAVDTGTVLVDESVSLGFIDLTPSILDVFCGKNSNGYTIAWVEKKSDYAYFNLLALDEAGRLTVPKKEVFMYYIPSPYRNNFSVEFLPSALYVFWTEINNPIDKFYQISRQRIDYAGNMIGEKEILTTPDENFRGALSTAVDGANNIHAVWIDQERTSKRLNSDVYYQQIDGSGASMTLPKTIVGKINTQKFPGIIISPDQKRIVSWVDLDGDRYNLLFMSTNPTLVQRLAAENRIADFSKSVLGHILNLFTSMASAVLFFIPYNLLPLLLLCLFLYLVVFKKRKNRMYYMAFLISVLPVKYFNALMFKDIFSEMANVSDQALLAINAVTLSLLAVATIVQFSLPERNGRLDRFSCLFAGWLYLDTVCALMASFLSTFRGGF